MTKKILILIFSLCLLTSCADSSGSASSSTASSSSEASSAAPVDAKLWDGSSQISFSGAKITIPNGYTAEESSSTISKSFKGTNGSIYIITEAFYKEMNEDTAKSKLDEVKDSDTGGTKWTYTDKKSSLITISDNPAIFISYHTKAERTNDSQEWDNYVVYFNSNGNTVRVSLQGELLDEGNFKKFCELIELPGVKNAEDISFDDVNYVEVDDLMIPIPKSFEVKSERDFDGENCNIHYYSSVGLYELTESEMSKEVEELKKGYNEPEMNMYQDNDVHSYKLDFIGGKMAYYISYTAKMKKSADDTDPTVIERTTIYLNSSKQGVYITLSGDMTKESNFKAFCDNIKYK